MMRDENADLTRAALMYAVTCFQHGNWAVLRDLNFGEKEIEALRNLQLPDIVSAAQRMHGHVLNISLDRERFWTVLHEIQAERAVEKLRNELVCREAPVDMMRHLFGMTNRQYTELRRRFRRGRGAGRPAEPDPEVMDTIWRAWHAHLNGREPKSAVEWLRLSDESGADCRTLWRFIRGANALERTS